MLRNEIKLFTANAWILKLRFFFTEIEKIPATHRVYVQAFRGQKLWEMGMWKFKCWWEMAWIHFLTLDQGKMLAHWKDESPSKDALFEIISKNLNLAFAVKY